MAGSPRPLHHTPSRSSTPDPIAAHLPWPTGQPPRGALRPPRRRPRHAQVARGKAPPGPSAPGGAWPPSRTVASPGWGPSFLPSFLTNPPAPPGPESCPQALAGPDCGEGDWPTGRLPGSRRTLPTGEHSAGGAPPGKGAPRPPSGQPLRPFGQLLRTPPGLPTGDRPWASAGGARDGEKGQRPTAAV